MFCQISSVHQTVLLTAMFLTMLLSVVLFFLHLSSRKMTPGAFVDIALFIILFLLVESFSEETLSGRSLQDHANGLHIPVWLLWCLTGCAAVWLMIGVIRLRRFMKSHLNLFSIKHAMDTLPVAVCFFSPAGGVKLCNIKMYRLFRTLAQRDLQSLGEFDEVLDSCGETTPVVRKASDRNTFIFPDGRVWYLSRDEITSSDNTRYTEVLFTDVTELYEKRRELDRQSRELKEIYRDIKRLSDNVLEMTREKEILTAKTRLHDQMGIGITAVRKILLQQQTSQESAAALEMWRRAISVIKDDNRYPVGSDGSADIYNDAAAVGITVEMTGTIPNEGRTGQLLLLAVRECLTNAARHADAASLYINAQRSRGAITLRITNDGNQPEQEITPKGGLVNLRRQLAECGGSMKIQSMPEFELTVTVPEDLEDKL